ncbi:MAG TPA: ribonuclease domain-containing protein [Kribbella sp.]|uniref:ribonuclease domain-containing protein n=1 Tax=Kribbella sp. TaxID=1871183 RepID=UPI002D76688B|nr:ribonuclease domain-containing protein [Kribbella sp.]HET6299499.1 ribonuclease domain-containing protein [Kribbella sp.]
MRTPSNAPRALTALATLLAALLLTLTATTSSYAGQTAPTQYAVQGGSGSAAPALTAALPSCTLSSLPSQARTTWNLIRSGGPFPYSQDGSVFQNREGLLPPKSSGYYHEYTVKTPGSSDRGARRLIGGGALTNPASLYYTADHYASFCLVNTQA